jgi:uncharacterized protein (DUF2267 family)
MFQILNVVDMGRPCFVAMSSVSAMESRKQEGLEAAMASEQPQDKTNRDLNRPGDLSEDQDHEIIGGELQPRTRSSTTGVRAFDSTIQKTNVWLKELMTELGIDNKEGAYSLFRAVLHATRDILPPHLAQHFASQLPMLVRGFFFEGWTLERKFKAHSKEEFYFLVEHHLGAGAIREVIERATPAVFAVLARHISLDELEKVQNALHADLKEIIPVGFAGGTNIEDDVSVARDVNLH